MMRPSLAYGSSLPLPSSRVRQVLPVLDLLYPFTLAAGAAASGIVAVMPEALPARRRPQQDRCGGSR